MEIESRQLLIIAVTFSALSLNIAVKRETRLLASSFPESEFGVARGFV